MNQNYHQRTGGKGNVHVADGTHACFKLIGAACDAGVQILNMTKFTDVVLREENENWRG